MSYKEEVRIEAAQTKAQLKGVGVEFDETPFVEYIGFGKSHRYAICKAKDVLEAYHDLKDCWQKDEYCDSLGEAMTNEVEENHPEFEVCSNLEWLQVNGGFDTGSNSGCQEDETDIAAFEEHEQAFRDEFEEFADFVAPKGNRSLLHQWNGAHFTHHNRGIATFDVLSEGAEKTFDAI